MRLLAALKLLYTTDCFSLTYHMIYVIMMCLNYFSYDIWNTNVILTLSCVIYTYIICLIIKQISLSIYKTGKVSGTLNEKTLWIASLYLLLFKVCWDWLCCDLLLLLDLTLTQLTDSKSKQ